MEIDEKLDNDIDKTIATKCLNGHKFKVPREKITSSASGKSFVTLCPKCNRVARLRKEDVFELFGINPRDHIAVGNLYASLSIGSTPVTGETSTTPPASSPVPFVGDNDLGDDDDEDDDIDEDIDDEEDEDEDEKEFVAIVESVPDVTGKRKMIQRHRVIADEDDETDDNENDRYEHERNKTPVKSPKKVAKPAKKARRPVRREEEYEDEMDDEEDYEPQRRSKRAPRASQRSRLEDEEFDPNEILMELIEESGLDEATIDRIADYVYMQPTGWQPAAIKGVLETYISPASANKIALRYSAELMKEEMKREKERTLVGMMGALPSNLKLFNQQASNSPPFNPPLQGTYPNQFQQTGYPPQGYPQAQTYPPVDIYAGTRSSVYPPAPRGVSALEAERLIDAKLDTKFKELEQTIIGSKREEAAALEAREMRNLVFELLKKDRDVPSASAQNPQVVEFMRSQGTMVDTLLRVALDKKPASPMDDPLVKILISELLSSKKATAPSLGTTSEELRQRIELQRLANDLEMSQADFKDKQDGRAFTRDLASQALSKIGEAAAAAYIESKRLETEAAKAIATQERIARMQGLVKPEEKPIAATVAQKQPEPQKQVQVPTETREPASGIESAHKVKGVPDNSGNIQLPCPTCESMMTARVGDLSVTCPVCQTKYDASAPISIPATTPATPLPVVRVDKPRTPEPIPDVLPEKVPDKIPEAVPEPEPFVEPEKIIEPEPVIEPIPFLDKTPEPDIVPEPMEEPVVKESTKKSRAKPAPKKKSERRVVVKKMESFIAS